MPTAVGIIVRKVGHLTKFNQNGDYNFLVNDFSPRYYLPILSDPTDEDTDDDKIPDGYDSDMKMPDDWYAFSDPNPLKSDINETVLEHDFFSVDYEFKEGAQEDWSLANNNNNNASYGGYQGWFGTYGIYENQKIFGSAFPFGHITGHDVRSEGCGLIAVADMFYYLLLQRNIIDGSVNQNNRYSHLSFDQYTDYVKKISGGVVFLPMNGGTVSEYIPGSLSLSIDEIQKASGLDLDSNWCISTDKKTCLKRIKGMLNDDIPVVYSCCVSDDNELQLYCFHNDYDMVYNAIEYKDQNGKNKKVDPVKNHYMVATGVIEYSADVEKIIGRKTMIKTATYGKMYYVDFDEYSENLSVVTNIFNIERSK